MRRCRTRQIGDPSLPFRKKPPRLRGCLENIVPAWLIESIGPAEAGQPLRPAALRPPLGRNRPVFSRVRQMGLTNHHVFRWCVQGGDLRGQALQICCEAHRCRCRARTRVVLLFGPALHMADMAGGEMPPECLVEWHGSSSGPGGGWCSCRLRVRPGTELPRPKRSSERPLRPILVVSVPVMWMMLRMALMVSALDLV